VSDRGTHFPRRKRLAWRLALLCWSLGFDRLGNYFEDVRWTT
jgi:hypothetical protein